MKDFNIEMYRDKNGKSQIECFINSMDKKTKAKFISYTDLLEEKSSFLGMPYSRYLENNIYELRIDVSNRFTRVLYFFIKDKRIIMTNGFIKKTNKTPRKEIERAIDYKKEYLERNK